MHRVHSATSPVIVLARGAAAAVALLSLVAFCAGCTTPRRAPIDDRAIAAAIERRAPTIEEMQAALAIADLGPLAVPRPRSPAALDPSDPEFWHACAFLYEPGVRQARRRLQAERARARGAGVVPSIDAQGMGLRGTHDREYEAMAMFDLLALLGLGPSAAARELARTQVCDALAELESAVWAARIRVDRALVRWRTVLAREAAAAALAAEANEDETRIAILERGGRVPPADVAWARATVHGLAQAASEARAGQAEARSELAMAAGLPPAHPALAGPPPAAAPAIGGGVADAAALLSRVPRLRALKLKYSIAEAQVRSAAAAAWPGLAVGPRIRLVPDDFLAGGIASVSIPLPAAVQPAIDAAVIERCAARDAVEDGLLETLSRAHAVEQRLAELGGNVRRHVAERLAGARAMWAASRSRFRADESALGGWNLALEALLGATLAEIATNEAIETAQIDLAEALGPDALRAPESRMP